MFLHSMWCILCCWDYMWMKICMCTSVHLLLFFSCCFICPANNLYHAIWLMLRCIAKRRNGKRTIEQSHYLWTLDICKNEWYAMWSYGSYLRRCCSGNIVWSTKQTRTKEKQMEQEEVMESSYCGKVRMLISARPCKHLVTQLLKDGAMPPVAACSSRCRQRDRSPIFLLHWNATLAVVLREMGRM